MFIDPVIMQYSDNLEEDRFVIATYYCATPAHMNVMKFAAALAVEQTCGTWIEVPGETPEVRRK